jgi:hypothetical protein
VTRFVLVRFPGDGQPRHALHPELGLARAVETLCELPEMVTWRCAGSTERPHGIDCGECRERAELIVALAARGRSA